VITHTHGNVVKSVKVREGLGVSLVFDEFFRSTMQETDVLQQFQ
jgi:hypothetical protein